MSTVKKENGSSSANKNKHRSTTNNHRTNQQDKSTLLTILCSGIILLAAFGYQFFRSPPSIEKRLADTLESLLTIEQNAAVNSHAKIAIGYGACLDYVVPSRCLLLASNDPPGKAIHHYSVTERSELLEVFAYYFNHGAAAERYINNASLFRELVALSENCDIIKSIGGNAPIMASRLAREGISNILLGAQMSPQLKKLLPESIAIAGPVTANDDVHLLIEYPTGENWSGIYSAPRANRFIVHNDDNNPLIRSLEIFHRDLVNFKPNLFIIGGLQMMEGYPSDHEKKRQRLEKIGQFIVDHFTDTQDQRLNSKLHFEMASYSDEMLLSNIVKLILPNVDSLGMNEQELPNLYQMLTYGNLTLVSDPYPRVATVLDQMRDVFEAMHVYSSGRISRIHVHTLAFQAILIRSGSDWKNTAAAAAKAALTSHRHTCGDHKIDAAKAKLIMDESFSTTRSSKQNLKRINFNSNVPVACWKEETESGHQIEICVAPVLVCTKVLQTGGGGDNVSAAGIALQL